MTIKNNRCHELGVCQGLSADQCPDCDSWECEVAVAEMPHTPHLQRSLPTCTKSQTFDRAPQPTFPFAPGVIQGPRDTPLSITMEDDGIWCASWQRELVAVVALVALAALLGAGVARWLA